MDKMNHMSTNFIKLLLPQGGFNQDRVFKAFRRLFPSAFVCQAYEEYLLLEDDLSEIHSQPVHGIVGVLYGTVTSTQLRGSTNSTSMHTSLQDLLFGCGKLSVSWKSKCLPGYYSEIGSTPMICWIEGIVQKRRMISLVCCAMEGTGKQDSTSSSHVLLVSDVGSILETLMLIFSRWWSWHSCNLVRKIS